MWYTTHGKYEYKGKTNVVERVQALNVHFSDKTLELEIDSIIYNTITGLYYIYYWIANIKTA
jgi:hypothetical protein